MSCDLANGRLEPCKDVVGGLDAVYFVNFGDYSGITYDGTNADMVDRILLLETETINSFLQV